jgi:hypothetical protein
MADPNVILMVMESEPMMRLTVAWPSVTYPTDYASLHRRHAEHRVFLEWSALADVPLRECYRYATFLMNSEICIEIREEDGELARESDPQVLSMIRGVIAARMGVRPQRVPTKREEKPVKPVEGAS